MTRQEAIHLIEWLQKTPTSKQFYGIIPEELLRYYEEQNPALNKPVIERSFTNVFVEIDGKPIPIRELPKIEYEEFLEGMHRLRLAYIAVVGH